MTTRPPLDQPQDEVFVGRIVPSQKDDDVDIGLVYDDVTGEIVGLYGHNNTEDTIHLSLGVGARVERITLEPFTTMRQRANLPAGRRPSMRPATIADHPWQQAAGWVAGFDSVTVERVYARPERNSPVVLSEAITEFVSSESTTHNVPMPATVNPGDLLDAGSYITGSSTISASGFTLTGSQANTSGDDTRLSLFAKNAVGNEDGTNVNFATSSSAFMYVTLRRIEEGSWSGDVADIEAAFATGTSTTPNPPNLAPSGGSADYLWIAWGCKDSSGTITSAPTNYTNLITGSGGANMGTARRTLEASSQDPGTFGGSSSQPYIAATEAIPPASGAEPLELDGSISGAGTLAGTLGIRRVLAGSLAGAGVLAGDLIARRALTGSLAGSGLLAGDMLRVRDLAGGVVGDGALAGTLAIVVVHDLTGSLTGSGTLAGDLTIFTVHDLTGALVGTATLEGDMLRVRDLTGQLVGNAVLAGDMVRVRSLTGSLTGTGSLNGTLVVVFPFPSSMDYRSVMRFRPARRR